LKRITIEIIDNIRHFMELVGFDSLLDIVEELKIEKIYRFDINTLWAVQKFRFKANDFTPGDLLNVREIGIVEIETLDAKDGEYTCLVKTQKENKFHELFSDFNLILPPDSPLALNQTNMRISFISKERQLKTVLTQLSQIVSLKVLSIKDLKYEHTPYFSLTQHQLELIQYAVNKGYYEIPRKVHIKEIAAHYNASISAVNELLRKVEKKVFQNLFSSAM